MDGDGPSFHRDEGLCWYNDGKRATRMAIAEKEVTGTKLPLDSLEIKGYRCFKELAIPKLARVNLITGKNNVGKTAVLEAVYLLARAGSVRAFWQILSHRNQL